ncbi:Methyl-CpG-binding domain-containing protein 9 [Apostasia shenzhenica]|uniref:Methyl-CpG-binding domain-containing protein 9 n=1 Tax=Apostasia shenzhenica TaxID=1088818 RepID=A0A2I0AC50_9ASPA|nr:Methyl-CpG-binding domain-containing protein 9 [Apostasia shenzhenica]
MSVNEYIGMKIESGNCNVCSAPCLSCMHYSHSLSVMGSNSENGCSGNICTSGETSSFFMADAKSRICDDSYNGASETSNILSVSSSHDSFSENAESKSTVRASGAYDLSDYVDMSQKKCSSEVVDEEKKIDHAHHPSYCQMPSDIGSRGSHVNDPMEKNGTLLDLDVDNSHGDNLLPHASNEGDNSESDSALDDVKVCDICGDAGREDFLAICSSCSDGAEHTYCMRKMLDKVPEGDWLCEECKMKEMENENVNKSDHVSGRLKPTCLSEKNQNSPSNLILKKLPKLHDVVTNLETRGLAKGIYSHKISTTRLADHLEGKKSHELSRPPGDVASPRKKAALSRESSFKNKDMDKVKNVNEVSSSEAPSMCGLRVLSRSQTFSRSQISLSNRSPKGQSQLQSSRGYLSRSVSFGNSINKPKVKQLIEDVHFRQKPGSEAVITSLRNEGFKSMEKSTSYKNLSSGFSNNQAAGKTQLLQSIHLDSQKGIKEVKRRNIVEKKNSFAADRSVVNSLAAPDSKCPVTINSKSTLYEGKVNNVPESSVHSINKGSDELYDLGGSRKPIPCPSKTIGSSNGRTNLDNYKLHQTPKHLIQTLNSASNGSCSKVDIASQCAVFQPSELVLKDRMADSTSSTSSRLSSSGNQHSMIDKQPQSTHKFSNELGSKGMKKTESRCIDELDEAEPMIRGKGNKVDKTEEPPAVSVHMISESASGNSSSTLCERNISSVVDNKNDQDSLKLYTVDSKKTVAKRDSGQLAGPPLDAFLVPKSESLNDFRTELNVKSFSDAVPSGAPLLMAPSRASAIPKLECIWQGTFNVLQSGSCPELFDGIQAHLSSYASDKVIEVSNKIPSKIVLEEVPHAILCPFQSQGVGPKEGNIALFFFAKDIECYDKGYSKLLDRMLKNDFSLKGNIDGTELLIFTSIKLPVNSQRWNRLFYLWGTFVGNRREKLSAIDQQKKPFESNSRMVISSDSIVQNLVNIPTSMHLPESHGSSKIKPDQSTTMVDLLVKASEKVGKVCGTQEASHVQNSGKWVVADLNVPLDSTSFLVNNSTLTMTNLSNVIGMPAIHEMPSMQSCFEVKHDGTCQDEIIDDGMNSRTSESSAHTTDIPVEASFSKASSVISTRNPGDECRNNDVNKRKRESSESDIAVVNIDSTGNTESRMIVSQLSSDNMQINTTEATLGRERESWMPSDSEREQKKTCYSNGKGLENVDLSPKLSSEIFWSCQDGRTVCLESLKSEVSRSAKHFLLSDKPDVSILLLSSDDEDNPKTPALELALGGMSKSSKPVPIHSLFPSVEGSNQKKQYDPCREKRDDISAASLTLSLGLPALGDQKSAESFSKSEQVLPEWRSVNKSLFMFGGSPTPERSS